MFFGLWSMDFWGQHSFVRFSVFSRRGEKEGRTTAFMAHNGAESLFGAVVRHKCCGAPLLFTPLDFVFFVFNVVGACLSIGLVVGGFIVFSQQDFLPIPLVPGLVCVGPFLVLIVVPRIISPA